VTATSRFVPAGAYEPAGADWQRMPFRFERFDADRVLVTNMVGEHLFLTTSEFEQFVSVSPPESPNLVRRLRAKHLIRPVDDDLPLELLALKTRTRFDRLAQFTALHMFVVSLRCDHSCPYCQVSRQSTDKARFDMSEETAERALELVFRSPSPQIKIEFQGGEPLLNFPLVRKIVLDAKAMNQHWSRDLSFVIATNLALLDDEVLAFCDEHDVFISTSLDGPRDLHNSNRPRPGHDSWELAVAGIRRAREGLGVDRVSALMTTTAGSLGRVREIVDTYLELGLMSIFLRPLSPYGFAIKTKAHAAYDVERWLEFYEEGLAYILELNAQGAPMMELYASLALKKMLTNVDPGYVDLASPARIGIGAVVYNYDGDVYASDEGRMLAEMGDETFRLGNVHEDGFEEIFLAEGLLNAIEESFTWSAPMCSECVYEPYCGADPVFHHATAGDLVGHKALSAFCRRNMAVFRRVLKLYEDDALARRVFQGWVAA
jgi:His-Xaa-Ser system radical SAM maturase HxsB